MTIKSAVDKSTMVQRYVIVEYNVVDRIISYDERGAFKNRFPLHHLVGEYHWSHLDTKHVIASILFHPHHKIHIEGRTDISLLPSLHSNKAVSKTVKKEAHWNALKKALAVEDTDSMVDIAESLANRYGSLFMPTR